MFWLIPILLATVALFALVAVYAERKVAAYVQDRLGPMEVGPRGSLQTLADIVKLLFKEPILPQQVDRPLFTLGPWLVFAAVFGGMALLPLAPGVVGSGVVAGALFIQGVLALDVIGLLMAGWGSNNKYALYGAVRSVAQIVSYEVPAGLALLAGLVLYGTLDLMRVAELQGVLAGGPLLAWGLVDTQGVGGLLSWGVVRYPHLLVAFVVFFVASLAEANRAPFDLPEAESELVGGFHTEYAGFGFAVLFLAEYAAMLLLSGLAVVVFLGGWNTPLPNLVPLVDAQAVDQLSTWALLKAGHLAHATTGLGWGVLWFSLKTFALIGVQMWVRWTFPRLRPDQLLALCWKYLTPFALAMLAVSVIWRAWESAA